MLDTTEPSVNSLLRRARAAFDARLPVSGRERAPRLPNSKRERDIVGSFADAIETGDIDAVVALLTDDAWLTMPPEPYKYQGQAAIGTFLRDRTVRRGRARFHADPRQTPSQHSASTSHPPNRDRATIRNARPHASGRADLGDAAWFGDSSVFPQFGLPRRYRRKQR